MTRYEHTQVSRLMIWPPILVAALVATAAAAESSPNREILLSVAVLLLITIPFFYKLNITIADETLRASLGVGILCKKVPLEDIAACEPIRIRWWYGWGIHLTPYGWLYNVAGWDAVAITLRDGRRLALGTDDPKGLVAAIRS